MLVSFFSFFQMLFLSQHSVSRPADGFNYVLFFDDKVQHLITWFNFFSIIREGGSHLQINLSMSCMGSSTRFRKKVLVDLM